MTTRRTRSRDRSRARTSAGLARLASYTMDTLTPGNGGASGAGGLTYSRGSPVTVRTGTSSLAWITNVDDAPIYSDGSVVRGALAEAAHTTLIGTNYLFNGTGWSAGSPDNFTTGQSDPAGGTNAVLLVTTSGGFNRYWQGSPAAGNYVYSSWRKAASANAGQFVTSDGITVMAQAATPTAWSPVVQARSTAQASFAAIPSDGRDWSANGGIAAGARSESVYLPNLQAGQFARSSIVNGSSGSLSCSAGKWGTANYSAHVSRGRIGFELLCSPLGSSSQYTTAMRLFTIDANNYAEINFSTRVVTVVINGASYSTASAASWTALGQTCWFVEAGAGLPTAVFFGTTAGVSGSLLGRSGAAAGAIVTSATSINICHNGGANVFDCVFQRVIFYNYNRRPAWAVG